MHIKSVAIALCCVLLAGGCTGVDVPDDVTLAITNVRIVDVAGGKVTEAKTVLVRDKTIVGIGEYTVPDGVVVLDGGGGYLIPGLRDMHVHETRRYAGLFVAHGITFVRDMWGSLEYAGALRRDIEKGAIAPDFMMAGNLIDGLPPFFPDANVVSTASDAKALVDSLAHAGAPFLKVYDALSEPVYDAIVAAAAEHGLDVVGHVPMGVSVEHVVCSGQRSIEHATNLLKGCTNVEPEILAQSRRMLNSIKNRALPDAMEAFQRASRLMVEEHDPGRCHDLMRLMSTEGTWITPTLVAVRGTWFRNDPTFREDPRLAYIFPETSQSWPPEAGIARFFSPETWAAGQAMYEQARLLIPQLAEHGVRIMAGSDAGAPYVYPGSGLQDELALLVGAGLSPEQALRAATVDAASFIGRPDDPGTVSVGARADLVLLGTDPLADIEAVRDVRAVVLRGRVLDRDDLDRLMDDAKGAVIEARQQVD